MQRSLIRHGNGASSWFRRAAEPELITQTEPQKLRRHTTCGHRGRVAFNYLKKRKQARVGVAQLTTAVTRHYTVDMVCASPNTNATFECDDESAKPQSLFYYLEESFDNAQQLRTGSTHDMHSNFCRVMWLKNTHAKDDLLLCWRRAATIVPRIRHKFRNRCPAVDSWRASCFRSRHTNKMWSHRCRWYARGNPRKTHGFDQMGTIPTQQNQNAA